MARSGGTNGELDMEIVGLVQNSKYSGRGLARAWLVGDDGANVRRLVLRQVGVMALICGVIGLALGVSIGRLAEEQEQLFEAAPILWCLPPPWRCLDWWQCWPGSFPRNAHRRSIRCGRYAGSEPTWRG